MGISPRESAPSNIDFASEVKLDRLDMLWKITAVASLFLMTIAFVFSSSHEMSFEVWVSGPLVMFVASLLTHSAINRQNLEIAARIFTGGAMLAVTIGLTSDYVLDVQILPFAFIPIIFIGGLLLSPAATFFICIVASACVVLVPSVSMGDWAFFGEYQVFAIALMFVSALLAAQVTGELYAITQWALQNYQRERRTNLDLFEKRQELQKSLKRSQALSDQLKDTNEELAEAHQAAEAAKNFRGQFLANMSHELRTPLNAIIGFSETMLKFPMMYDNTDLPDVYKKDLEQIYGSGRQLLHLINDILDLARVDAGKLEIYMQRVEIKPIIDAVLATAGGLIGNKPIELDMQMPDPPPDVWGDESRVRQVLLNLYSNATKFTDAGQISLVVKETDEGVQFSIRDTGNGIEPEALNHIFEEFEQTQQQGRDPRAGSGLGLAISRQLLDLMGGRIWAESVPGEGSIFYFLLQPYHKAKVDTVETKAISTYATETPVAESSGQDK